jgi:hypothetical protein
VAGQVGSIGKDSDLNSARCPVRISAGTTILKCFMLLLSPSRQTPALAMTASDALSLSRWKRLQIKNLGEACTEVSCSRSDGENGHSAGCCPDHRAGQCLHANLPPLRVPLR